MDISQKGLLNRFKDIQSHKLKHRDTIFEPHIDKDQKAGHII